MAQHATAEVTTEGLGRSVARIGSVLGANDFPSGERAALRRLDPGGVPSLDFYRFAFRHLPAGWETHTRQWLVIVAGIALMSPGAHQHNRPAGQALAESGYAEARLERLLAAEDDTLHRLLLRAARFLAAKNETCDWTDLARLLLSQHDDRREAARLAIARSYYRHLREKESA